MRRIFRFSFGTVGRRYLSMPQNINKQRVRNSFTKSLFSYNQHAAIQASMADDLVYHLRRWHPIGFDRVLEFGCGAGLLTDKLLKSFQIRTLYVNDLVEECRQTIAGLMKQYPESMFDFIGGDIEELSRLPERLDLIISNATVQWLTDLPTFFPKMKTLLKSGGLLVFSTFGPENLREIRRLTGVSLSYPAYKELQSLMKQHFQIVWCEEIPITLNFSSPRAVLRHLRLTGVTGVSRQHWTKTRLQEFEQQYWEAFSTRNQIPLTYHPILCIVKT
jgi:malonyl-ACP O-methyltransferase BioC